jgi:FimV-like protein
MKHKTLAVATGLLLAASLSLQPLSAQAGAAYGPVKNNDTLWDIASRRRPSFDISVPQMMAAIQAQNPDAFVAGDMNHLRKGVYLKIPVLPEVSQSAGKQASQASLQGEISQLRTQLTEEQTRSMQLAEQLKQLQASTPATSTASPSVPSADAAKQAELVKLQTALVVKLQVELVQLKQQLQAKDTRITELQTASAQVAALPNTSLDPAAATPAQTQQADTAMQAELQELKQLLEQRDAHIQNLQASLREASISIKQQYAESQALHARLKELEPGNTSAAPPPPPEPGASTPPSLTLATEEPASAATVVPVTPPAFTDQVTTPATPPTGTTQPVSLQNMLEQHGTGNVGSDAGKLPTPSRVSLVVALVSLIFVLALLWRSFSQRSALNKEEARLRAELEA